MFFGDRVAGKWLRRRTSATDSHTETAARVLCPTNVLTMGTQDGGMGRNQREARARPWGANVHPHRFLGWRDNFKGIAAFIGRMVYEPQRKRRPLIMRGTPSRRRWRSAGRKPTTDAPERGLRFRSPHCQCGYRANGKRWRLLAVAALLLYAIARPAYGSAFATLRHAWRRVIHASVATDYFNSDRLLDDKTGFYGLNAWLSATRHITRHTRAHVALQFTDPNVPKTNPTAKVLEAYVARDWGNGSVRVGNQIVAWGRANGVNPTDNLTPRDYTVLLPSTAEQRFGTPSLVWNEYLNSRYTLTTFVTPFFTPSIIPIPEIPGVTFIQQTPAAALHNTEGALKLSYSGNAGDLSVSAFRGFNLLPNLAPNGTQGHVAFRYNRMIVLGADGDLPLGKWLAWFEAAYKRPLGLPYASPSTQKPSLYLVEGVGRTLAGTLNLSAQVVYGHIYDYLAPSQAVSGPAQAIAVENNIINGAEHRNNYGWTFQIMDNWIHQTLQGKLFFYVDVRPINTYTRLTFSYQVSDHTTVTIGAEYYAGPPDTSFGQLVPNRTAFAQWRYYL